MASTSHSPPDTKPDVNDAAPGVWRPAQRAAQALMRPLESFLKIQASSGLLLMFMAVLAMLWANSPWAESYVHLWHTPITIGFGELIFEQDLHFWINDGLMVIFFFVVGLEIRREIHHGELSELKRAALPVAAAIGGMLVPAVIYLSLNTTKETSHGWGVPMATDIAFAVGVLALLGNRVPSALRVLLLALAIIDDIGAILVIALFYSSGVQLAGLGIAAVGLLFVILLQRLGVRQALAYVPAGAVLWAGMLSAGIHPTIAGVILGLLTPAQPWFGWRGFLNEANRAISDVERKAQSENGDDHSILHELARIGQARREAIAPVVRLEAALHPWVAFGIMPLFALANAGVTIGEVDISGTRLNLALGIAFGLAVGKPIGIVCVSLLAVKSGICVLPSRVDGRGLFIVGCVGGIGFTMALFIAQLAFQDPARLGVAKVAVLAGSAVAAVVGLVAGRALLKPPEEGARILGVDEVERSTTE